VHAVQTRDASGASAAGVWLLAGTNDRLLFNNLEGKASAGLDESFAGKQGLSCILLRGARQKARGGAAQTRP
jgi:hypothetical protein